MGQVCGVCGNASPAVFYWQATRGRRVKGGVCPGTLEDVREKISCSSVFLKETNDKKTTMIKPAIP
jgi:hypothetical protein